MAPFKDVFVRPFVRLVARCFGEIEVAPWNIPGNKLSSMLTVSASSSVRQLSQTD